MPESDNEQVNVDIESLLLRIEALELENSIVKEEVKELRKQVQHNNNNKHTKAKSVDKSNPRVNNHQSLSKQERERRSILPISGKLALDKYRRRIQIGDSVYAYTKGQFESRLGVVTAIGSDKSDRIFFKDEQGYIQNRACHNLIIQESTESK